MWICILVSLSPLVKIKDIPFYLIHSDIWGSQLFQAFLVLVGFSMIILGSHSYSFSNKSQMLVILFFPSTQWFEIQFGVKIKTFRTDTAIDYFTRTLSPYFRSLHYPWFFVSYYTTIKQKNGHLLNTNRELILNRNLPKTYWAEAIPTATHMINHLSSRVLNNLGPIEVLNKFHPHFRTSNGLTAHVFGCTQRSKHDLRAIKCVLGILRP